MESIRVRAQHKILIFHLNKHYPATLDFVFLPTDFNTRNVIFAEMLAKKFLF